MRKNDEYFKFVLSVKDNAQEFIQKLLPNDLVSALKLETLELDNTSYVDAELRKFYTDIVYRCHTVEEDNDKEITIVLLFDHKSEVPDYPHLSMMKYFLKIWDYNIRQKVELQQIIPIFVYHGLAEWKVKAFPEYFGSFNNRFKGTSPLFDYYLVNISEHEDRILRHVLFAREALDISMELLHYAYRSGLLEHLPEIVKRGVPYYDTEEGLEFYKATTKYLLSVIEGQQKVVIDIIAKVYEKGVSTVMTIAENLKLEGKLEDAKRMVEKGYANDEINDITGLPIEDIQKLRESD